MSDREFFFNFGRRYGRNSGFARDYEYFRARANRDAYAREAWGDTSKSKQRPPFVNETLEETQAREAKQTSDAASIRVHLEQKFGPGFWFKVRDRRTLDGEKISGLHISWRHGPNALQVKRVVQERFEMDFSKVRFMSRTLGEY